MVKKITIRELANQAGMSMATVSGVLNGETRFSEATRKHVWNIANELNYVPSTSARNLRTGSSSARTRTNLLMHIVHLGGPGPEVGTDVEATLTNFVYQARQAGFFSIPYLYYQQAGFQCPPLLNDLIDGAVIGTPHPEVVRTVAGKVPVVLMDVPFSVDFVEVPMVNTDYRYGFYSALGILKERGIERIVSVSSAQQYPGTESQGRPVIEALTTAAKTLSVSLLDEWSFYEELNSDNHETLLYRYAERLAPQIRNGTVRAVVGVNCNITETLTKAFRQMNIRVPDDVYLLAPHIGFTPPEGTASIFTDRSKLIEAALELLQGMLAGKKVFHYENLVRPRFIEKY